MTPLERAAAEALYCALTAMACSCVSESPGSRKLLHECSRCAAMWKWERVVLEELGTPA